MATSKQTTKKAATKTTAKKTPIKPQQVSLFEEPKSEEILIVKEVKILKDTYTKDEFLEEVKKAKKETATLIIDKITYLLKRYTRQQLPFEQIIKYIASNYKIDIKNNNIEEQIEDEKHK